MSNLRKEKKQEVIITKKDVNSENPIEPIVNKIKPLLDDLQGPNDKKRR